MQRPPYIPMLALLPVLGGCATTVTPPADPAAPRPAFLIDHGRHSTLVLTNNAGDPVRYAFGKVDWYTGTDIGLFRGLAALLIPDSGTLGRRVLPGPPTADNIRAVVGVSVEALHCIAVAGDRTDRLMRALNLVFDRNQASMRYSAGWNLEFVENPEDYWFGENANEAVASWLQELDCEVSGSTTFANWKINRTGDVPGVCVEGEGVRN